MVEKKVKAKFFYCSFEGCTKSFDRQQKLDQHESDHLGLRPFSCSFEGCDKTFTRKTHVKRHELTHTGEKPYECTEENCNLRFFTKQHLNRHVALHKVPKPFICEHEGCTEAFAKRNQLQRHLCIHTGRKPYPCDHIDEESQVVCPMEFNYPGQLRKHKITHTKRYYCGFPQCGASFSNITEMRTHTKNDHEIKRKTITVQCEICGKILNSSLAQHMATHNSDPSVVVPCIYPNCIRTYASKEALQIHIDSVHLGLKHNEKEICPQCNNTYASKGNLKRHLKICKGSVAGEKREREVKCEDGELPPLKVVKIEL